MFFSIPFPNETEEAAMLRQGIKHGMQDIGAQSVEQLQTMLQDLFYLFAPVRV